MNSIVNMFYGLDNSIENTKLQKSEYKNKNNSVYTPALNQGINFKNYQNKIKNNIKRDINNVNSKEGFQNFNNSNTSSSTSSDGSYQLAEQSKQILNDTSSGTDKTLQNEYNVTLLAYQKLLAKVSGGTNDYIDRVSPTNTYLNKLVSWSDPSANGAVMYVTNQGVAKPINDKDVLKSILGTNGCPTMKSMVSISLPWDSSYLIEGTTIPTKPTLVVGPVMTKGESCGNEGNNVYVDTLLTNSNATYNGCYADDASSPVMTFIGGAPQTISGIENGNFSQPTINNNTYQYITSQTQVPSWNFGNAVLVNNSSAWGYPTPYPNGNQCACIQNTAYMEQVLNLSTGNYTLSFMACGRKSQDGPNKVDIQLNGTTFFSVTPTSNVWTSYSSSFTVSTSGNNTLRFSGTNSSGDKSSAFQNISLDTSGASTTSGTYTYDMCKNAAIDGGYKYFALQNVNTETSTGYCGVSNDYVSSTKNGTAYAISGVVSLWDSKTNGSGSYTYLTSQGTLTVYNSSGASIFNTTVDSSLVSGGYIGCYNDTSTRAMTNTSNNNYYSFDTCKQYAIDGGYKYYGSQNKDNNNNGWCVASNDLTSSQKYGVANNCTKDSSGNYMGGGWSNAIYSSDYDGSYYLILQDDGNMCVYKGTSPSDNQGLIWQSKTNGKQQKPDPLHTAEKGKYGKNWILSGSGLSVGDFVGSTDGSIYLIMQSDGNLVLYTSTNDINCKTMKDNNTGGGSNANALYELASVGIPGNMGKVAYVDSNSILYPYPDSSIGLSNDYSSYTNFSSAGHDISGKSFSNATVDSCKSACNDLKECYGFDFDKTNNVCYPKDNTMYPKGSRSTSSSVDLYVRKPKITNPPTGVTDKIFNTDSLTYDNYTKSDKEIESSYGLSNANSVEKQQLDQLKTKLDQISQQLADNTGNLNTDEIKVGNQSTLQTESIGKYLKEYEKTNTKIKNYSSGNMAGIVHDSDINVLKENYNYYFWSILAVGTVLVTMNVTKK
jgi:hypothetical protein